MATIPFLGVSTNDNVITGGGAQLVVPIEPAVVLSLEAKEDKNKKGVANGYAPLDVNAKVPTVNLPDVVSLDAEVDAKITTHNSATTSVHGIANTANLVLTNDARLADTRDPKAHTHTKSNITDFTHTHAVADVTGLQTALDGKALSSHSHAISDVTNLQNTLDGKQPSGSYAPSTGISPSAITGTAVVTNDSRLSDSRAPTAHKTSHATGGADALTPADIGASPTSHSHNTATSGSAGFMSASDKAKLDGVASGAGVSTNADWTAVSGGAQILNKPNSFTPTAHKSSHATGGADALTPADIGAQPSGSYAPATGISPSAITGTAVVTDDSRLTDNRAPTSHAHGNITNAGAIGSTANLPLITTTSGVVTTGSFGTTANTFAQGNDSRFSDNRTPTSHTHPSSEISDSTTAGRALLTASTTQAQRTALDIFLSYANLASFPVSGNLQRLYLALDTQKTYVWNGASYIEISPNTHTRAGTNNTNVGETALLSNTFGNSNTAVGASALYANTTGDFNTANGYNALLSNTTGTFNTANGVFALQSNTTGHFNTANGVNALRSNTTGFGNTANGVFALQSNTTGLQNTANGESALTYNTTGNTNTANGVSALRSNTTGIQNTANGVSALLYNTTGNGNTANGVSALQSNTTGSGNTANGVSALQSNTTGNFNTANGVNALLLNTTGGSNVALGYQAGDIITSGSNNICIGAGADVNAGTRADCIAIGAGAVAQIDGEIAFSSALATKTTIGANGGATALTALPVGYIRIRIGANAYQLPYYNV